MIWNSAMEDFSESKEQVSGNETIKNEPEIDQPPANPWVYDEYVDSMTWEWTRTAECTQQIRFILTFRTLEAQILHWV